MSRYSSNHRDDIRLLLLERDGPICQRCKSPLASFPNIVVDHIDNSKHHNCLSNLQLLCYGCNNSKSHWYHDRKEQEPAFSAEWLTCPYNAVFSGDQALYVCAETNTSEPTNIKVSYNENGTKETIEDMGDFEKVTRSRPSGECEFYRKKQTTAAEVQDEKTKTATMRKNDRCEKPFNVWLNEQLRANAAFSIEEWCNGGANQFECSQESVWRYLKKRLDLPDCNPINGDLTLAPYQGKQVIVFKQKN